jgi:hypothetical protein
MPFALLHVLCVFMGEFYTHIYVVLKLVKVWILTV